MSDTPTEKPRREYPPRRPKVPPFARYQGTSAWHKDRRRMRAYAWFLRHEAQKQAAGPSA